MQPLRCQIDETTPISLCFNMFMRQIIIFICQRRHTSRLLYSIYAICRKRIMGWNSSLALIIISLYSEYAQYFLEKDSDGMLEECKMSYLPVMTTLRGPALQCSSRTLFAPNIVPIITPPSQLYQISASVWLSPPKYKGNYIINWKFETLQGIHMKQREMKNKECSRLYMNRWLTW
jgi:hypothetical protein